MTGNGGERGRTPERASRGGATGVLAAGFLLLTACEQTATEPVSAAMAQALEEGTRELTERTFRKSGLSGDGRPLAWSAERQAAGRSHCEGKTGCGLTLPLGIPPDCMPRPGPPPRVLSAHILFGGCGYLGARMTYRNEHYPEGVANELWYDLSTGALVGTGARGADRQVTFWGTAPPLDCELRLCDPCALVRVDSDAPAESALFGLKTRCDLKDVDLDPALQGEWQRTAPGAGADVPLEPEANP